jgi:phosphatidate cytidylyltransferase
MFLWKMNQRLWKSLTNQMNNILLRSLTGAVFVSTVLIPLFWNDIATAIVFGLYMALGLTEFYKLFKNSESIDINWELGLTYGIIFYGSFATFLFSNLNILYLAALIPLLFFVVLIELWRQKKNPILNSAVITLGIIYVTVPFVLMICIQFFDKSTFPLLAGMFLLIWMNDTFAYLSGRFFGKTKLIERISPNKTWEGTIGGIIFTLLAGLAIGYLFDPEKVLFWFFSAILIAPCAGLGDLLESLFKRNMNVKDSGNLLPGHGGVLDRFDAVLFTVPFFFIWVCFYFYF